jgi:hypothetical protein
MAGKPPLTIPGALWGVFTGTLSGFVMMIENIRLARS